MTENVYDRDESSFVLRDAEWRMADVCHSPPEFIRAPRACQKLILHQGLQLIGRPTPHRPHHGPHTRGAAETPGRYAEAWVGVIFLTAAIDVDEAEDLDAHELRADREHYVDVG